MGDNESAVPEADPESLMPAQGEFFDPWLGQELAGYKLDRRLGEGGMGIVYLGRHASLGRLAAVKFLGAHMVDDKEYISRFLREAQGAAKLNHPNIVQVYDAGTMGGDVYYFIMEYIEGKDLGILLREQHIFSVPEAIGYIREAAGALGYAHKKQIIHRDVKPDNLMLTADKVIKVGDLGLAKWTSDEGAGGMTQTGVVMGTPFYISPEQVRGARDVSSRSDIYSLGATLYHLVTSKIPYDGSSPAVIMSMHLNNPVPEPSKVNPALDRDICAIIRKMMAKKPDDRYQSMEEVDTVLMEYLSRSSHPTQILSKPAMLSSDAQPAAAQHPAAVSLVVVPSEAGSRAKVGLITGISTLVGAMLLSLIITAHSHRKPVGDVVPVVPIVSAVPSKLPTPPEAAQPAETPVANTPPAPPPEPPAPAPEPESHPVQ